MASTSFRPPRDLLMPSDREVISEQLRAAARIIQEEGPNEQAAWRLAEAWEDFVNIVRASGESGTPGIDTPTGRGTRLIIEKH